jgi:hypothetical protein
MLRKLFGFLRGECRIGGDEMEVVRGVWVLRGWKGNGGKGRKLLGRCIYVLGILRLTIMEERGLGMLTGRQYCFYPDLTEGLTRILPVNRHLSTRSVESDPAVNNLKSSSLGTLYPFVWKLSGSLITRAMRDTLG